MKNWKWIILVLGVSITATAWASGLKLQPGLWQLTTKMTVSGMPFAMPPRTLTLKKCLTRDQIQHPWREYQKRKNCKQSGLKLTGNSASWQLACTGENAMQGEGSMRIDSPTKYHGQMTMTGRDGGQTMKTHVEFSAHRVGACKDGGR